MVDGVRPRVVMQQAWLPRYRQPFFERVRAALADRGIDFELVHGQPYGDDATKASAGRLEWAVTAEQRVWRVGSTNLTWQPCLRHMRGADLVICEQAASQLVVYALLAQARVRSRQRFAFWGHGRNFQHSGASQVGEAVKRWMSRRADWWFAYNERSVDVLRSIGYPGERITNFQNAIDTDEIVQVRQRLTPADLEQLKGRLGLASDDVAVYVGGMYREKRLRYLIAACDEIRAQVPQFHMLFIGAGPEASTVAEAARDRPWMHHLGARFGEEKVALTLLGKLQLMPGLVGLTILDSFAIGLPLITVADSEHSPEVDYLEDGINGVMLPAGTTPQAYATRVVELLRDETARTQLAEGCARARSRYTLDVMVERFVAGVEDALDQSVRPHRSGLRHGRFR